MTVLFDPARQRARLMPDKFAFVEMATGAETTYAEFDRRAERIATWLEQQGLAPGERVAVICQNTVAFFELLFAAAKAGLILVPLNWRQTEAELAPILFDCDARLVIHDETNATLACKLAGPRPCLSFADVAAKASTCAQREDRDTAWPLDRVWYLLYTSGTTGKPKAVIQTPGMMLANAINVATACGLTDADAMINFLPLFHTAGINLHTLPVFFNGGTSHVIPKFDIDAALALLTSGKITVFFGVPAIYQALSLRPDFDALDFSAVRHWGCGGAPLPEPLIRQFMARGIHVCNGMGMTETGPTAFFMDRAHVADKVGSVGKPQIMTEVRLVDAFGHDVAPGEQGEILFRGPNITPGYYGNADATAKTFAPGGWLKSGDVGRRDADGYYFIVDRIKDMYISGGENVYPAEVEAVLNNHPAVLEAIVVGVQDEKWGEVGHAFIRLRPGMGLDADAARAFARARLAAYKVPKHVTLVDDYPRTAAGKVQKHVLIKTIAEVAQ